MKKVTGKDKPNLPAGARTAFPASKDLPKVPKGTIGKSGSSKKSDMC